ncbi:MAG: TIM-barrel domain-containing protein [Myxococcales bacterium]
MGRRATFPLLLLAACSGPQTTTVVKTAGYQVTVDSAGGFHVLLPDGGAVLDSVASPSTGFAPALWAERGEEVDFQLGQFGFVSSRAPWVAASVDGGLPAKPVGTGGTATLSVGGGTLAFTAQDDATLQIVLTPPASAQANQTAMAFACTPADHFVGFGEQTNALDQRGLAFGLWTMEDGIGKRAGANHVGDGYDPTGNTNDSYFPMPSFIDPRGFGLLVDESRYVEVDLCSSRPDAFSLAAWDGSLSLHVVLGQTPRELVTRLTALTGREPLSAPWTYGVWVDAVQGEARVQTVAAELRDAGVPSSALWTEDWAGEHAGVSFNSFDWTPDETLYPGFSSLASSLHQEGFKWLGYFNSFVIQGSTEWGQAMDAGGTWLVQSPDGGPYVFTGSSLEPTALVDLTNPAATAWMGAAMQAAARAGLDGWMADFGEWLPFDAVMADGTTGAETHNRFPLLWSKLNQGALSAALPGGDFVFFTRSGWTGQAGQIPAMWAGDQNTSWGFLPDGGPDFDGLPSVLPMGMNVGLQGIAAWGSDIGGYTTLISPPTTKELYLRWTEVGAFSPVMRTHHGYQANQDWRFDSDAETLAIFGKYAREHLSLFPYLYTLAGQTAASGIGVMLPIWLTYPDDLGALGRLDEYTLGPSLLVAPVIVQGATTRAVHLPPGHWLGWETPDAYDGPTDVTVPAPLDACPVYAIAGSVIPLLGSDVQTLASATDPAVKTLAQSNGELTVRAFLGASGSFTSYDGTQLTLTSSPGATVTGLAACAGSGPCPSVPSCDGGAPPCGDIDAVARLATAQVQGQEISVAADTGTVVTVDSPTPRLVTVQLRY